MFSGSGIVTTTIESCMELLVGRKIRQGPSFPSSVFIFFFLSLPCRLVLLSLKYLYLSYKITFVKPVAAKTPLLFKGKERNALLECFMDCSRTPTVFTSLCNITSIYMGTDSLSLSHQISGLKSVKMSLKYSALP